jgi:hypothetical protein
MSLVLVPWRTNGADDDPELVGKEASARHQRLEHLILQHICITSYSVDQSLLLY